MLNRFGYEYKEKLGFCLYTTSSSVPTGFPYIGEPKPPFMLQTKWSFLIKDNFKSLLQSYKGDYVALFTPINVGEEFNSGYIEFKDQAQSEEFQSHFKVVLHAVKENDWPHSERSMINGRSRKFKRTIRG